MTAHDDPVAKSWAVIDRPYNSDASRLFLSMSAHSKFLEIRRSVVVCHTYREITERRRDLVTLFFHSIVTVVRLVEDSIRRQQPHEWIPNVNNACLGRLTWEQRSEIEP